MNDYSTSIYIYKLAFEYSHSNSLERMLVPAWVSRSREMASKTPPSTSGKHMRPVTPSGRPSVVPSARATDEIKLRGRNSLPADGVRLWIRRLLDTYLS